MMAIDVSRIAMSSHVPFRQIAHGRAEICDRIRLHDLFTAAPVPFTISYWICQTIWEKDAACR